MKIMIAVDASTHSELALDFVARMRWPAGSRVIVVSALHLAAAATAAAHEPGAAVGVVLQEQRQQVEALVQQTACTLREAGFPTEGRVLVGDPREALVQVAHDERADLLVVGSRGRTGLTKLMLGSVSSHVVTHAPCSVLVVKQVGRTPSGEKEERS